MAKKKSYSEETKAEVMAALLSGQSVTQAAQDYKIPRGTIAHWSKEANEAGLRSVSNDKKGQIGDLLAEYLTANITALKAQAEQFADRDWLANQGASEAAVLHGVMTDKAIKLIEAFGEAQD